MPEGKRDRPPDAIPPGRGHLQDTAGLLTRQRLDLVLGSRGGIDQGRHVPCDLAAPHGDSQRARKYPVNLENAARRKTTAEHKGIGGVQVLRREPVQAMFSSSGLIQFRVFDR